MEDCLLEKMNKKMKDAGYSTKTEFIREAIRDKLSGPSTEELMKEFMKFYGKAKKHTTYEENRKTREKVSKELMAEMDRKFR